VPRILAGAVTEREQMRNLVLTLVMLMLGVAGAAPWAGAQGLYTSTADGHVFKAYVALGDVYWKLDGNLYGVTFNSFDGGSNLVADHLNGHEDILVQTRLSVDGVLSFVVCGVDRKAQVVTFERVWSEGSVGYALCVATFNWFLN
jgi:hypothetical protein